MTLTVRFFTWRQREIFAVLDSVLSDAWHVKDFYSIPRRSGGFFHYVTLERG